MCFSLSSSLPEPLPYDICLFFPISESVISSNRPAPLYLTLSAV